MLNYKEGRHEIKFDTQRFQFRELVINELSNVSEGTGGPSLKDLALVHKLPNIEKNVEKYRQVLFSLFRSQAFQRVYKSFGLELIDTHFGGIGLLQKTPTVRIQLPGAESTSYHSDGWYGHGESVRSFWLPLTDVGEGNSLSMASEIAASAKCLADIQASKASLPEINEISRKICDAFVGGYGDILTFSSAMMHGANRNEKHYARLSFDFRIAPNPNDIGTKPASNFYTRDELVSETEGLAEETGDAHSELSAMSYSNLCGGVSAKAQLMLCSAFAEASNISIVANESEIVTLEYMPVLRHYASGNTPEINCIILFGLDVFDGRSDLAREVFEIALENDVTLVFCAEGLTLNDSDSMRDILTRL